MTADGLWHRTRGAAAKEQRAHNCNSVMGAFNEMRQALAHIASKSDPTKPHVLIRDTTGVFFKWHDKLLERVGRHPQWQKRLHEAEAELLQRQAVLFSAAFPAGYFVFDVPDGKWRPDAKLGECRNRRARRQRGRARKKLQRPLPGSTTRPAQVPIMDSIKTKPPLAHHWVVGGGNNDGEADCEIGAVLVEARKRRPARDKKQLDVPAPHAVMSARERLIHTLAAVQPEQVIVMTLDGDDVALNTALERGWTLVPSWTGKADLSFAAPAPAPAGPVAAAAAGPAAAPAAPAAQAAPRPRRRVGPPRVLVVAAEGIDALPGFGSNRDERVKQTMAGGCDYTKGIFGVGQGAVRAGILRESLGVEWAVPNALELREALRRDVQLLIGRDAVAVAWRKEHRLKPSRSSAAELVPNGLVFELILGYEAASGRTVPRFEVDKLRYDLSQPLPEVKVVEASRLPARPPRAARPEDKTVWHGRVPPPVPSTPAAKVLAHVVGAAKTNALPFDPRRNNPLRMARERIHDVDHHRLTPAAPTRALVVRHHPTSHRTKPHASGPSQVMQMLEHAPEPRPPARPPKAAAAADAAAAAADDDDEKNEADEQEAVEVAQGAEQDGDDDDDPANVEGDNTYGTAASSTSKRLDSFYQGVSSELIETRAIERCLDGSVVHQVERPAPGPPRSSSTRSTTSGASKRTARNVKTFGWRATAAAPTAAGPPVAPPPAAAPLAAVPPGAAPPPGPAAGAPPAPRATVTVKQRSYPVSDLLAVVYFVVQVSLPGIMAAWVKLVQQQVDRGEVGYRELASTMTKRNELARMLSHVAYEAHVGPVQAGATTPDIKPEIQTLVANVYTRTPYDRPPAMSVSFWTPIFVPYQTSVREATARRLPVEWAKLGAFFGEDVVGRAQAVVGLGFWTSPAPLVGLAIVNGARTALGTLSPDKRSKLEAGMSSWCSELLSASRFQAARAALGSAGPEQTQSVPTPWLDAEVTELRKLYDAAGLGEDDHRAVSRLVRTVLKALLAWRDRAVQIAIEVASSAKKASSFEGQTLEEIVKDKAVASALLPLSFALRQGLNMDDLVPTFQPTCLETDAIELARLMAPTGANLMFDGAERLGTSILSALRPSIRFDGRAPCRTPVEHVEPLLKLFDALDNAGEPLDWPADSHTPPGRPRAVLVDEKNAIVREHLRKGLIVHLSISKRRRDDLSATYVALQDVFGISGSLSDFITRNSSSSDVLNLMFSRHRFDSAFVPTGHFKFSAFQVGFYGVSIDRVRANVLKQEPGLVGTSIGILWSAESQRPNWTSLNTTPAWLARAADGTVAREFVVVSGQVVERPILPLAELNAELRGVGGTKGSASVLLGRAHAAARRADAGRRLADARRRLANDVEHEARRTARIDKAVARADRQGGTPQSLVDDLTAQHGREEAARAALAAAATPTCPLALLAGHVRKGTWQSPGSMRDGVPKRWRDLRGDKGIHALQGWLDGTPLAKLDVVGIDPGEILALAYYVSVGDPAARARWDADVDAAQAAYVEAARAGRPTGDVAADVLAIMAERGFTSSAALAAAWRARVSAWARGLVEENALIKTARAQGDAVDLRSEASGSYGRNALLELQRRASQEASAYVTEFMREIVVDDDDAARLGRTKFPVDNVVAVERLEVLRRISTRRQRLVATAEVRRKSHYRQAASDLADKFLGGELYKDKPYPADKKLAIFVGAGIYARSGQQQGAQITAPLLRAVEAEIKSRPTTVPGQQIDCRFFITPEDFTSQCCANPDCVDGDDERSRVTHASLDIGGKDSRLCWCARCEALKGRDDGGGSNIVAMALSLWKEGRRRWSTSASR